MNMDEYVYGESDKSVKAHAAMLASRENRTMQTNPVYMTTDLDTMQVNGGVRIIHALPTSEHVNGNRLFKVLGQAIRPEGGIAKFVTWMWEEGTSNYFWGNYFHIATKFDNPDYEADVRNTYHKALSDLITR